MNEFAGWRISQFTHHGRPHYSASRHGVSMNHHDLEALKRMILEKNARSRAGLFPK